MKSIVLAVVCLFSVIKGWAQESTTIFGRSIESYSVCADAKGRTIGLQKINYPDLGKDVQVDVGQSMIAYYNVYLVDISSTIKMEADKPISFRGSHVSQDFETTIPAGLKLDVSNGASTFKIEEYIFQYANDSSPRGSFSRPILTLTVDPIEKTAVATLDFGFSKKKYPIDVKFVEKPGEKCLRWGENTIKRELVYGGVSQGTITISYREYANDMARPAFFQELRYDLKDGDEIGFKGARFKVKRANNLGKNYSVGRHLQ